MKRVLGFVGGVSLLGLGVYMIRNVFFSGHVAPDVDLVLFAVAELLLALMGIGLLATAFQRTK